MKDMVNTRVKAIMSLLSKSIDFGMDLVIFM